MSQERMSYVATPDKGLPEVYITLLDTLESLDVYTHVILQRFPKYERFLLCAEIRSSLNQIRRLVITAWKRYHKQTTFRDLDVEKEVLVGWIKKSRALEYITPGQSVEWLEIVAKLGRQLGGWVKHEKSKS